MEPVKVWGHFSAGWKEGLLPLPVSQGLAVLSGVLCHWILGSPQAVSLPGAVWEPRGAQRAPRPCACWWGLFAQGHLVSIQ